MKKLWGYIAAFFIGFSSAMTIAFYGKRTTVNKSSDTIQIKKPKIKGNNSSMENVLSSNDDSQDISNNKKRKLLKKRRIKNET